jgi:putative ABC transport system ATP-binding protein
VTHENDIAAWARRAVRMRDGLIESDVRNDQKPETTEVPPVVRLVEPPPPVPPEHVFRPPSH